MQTSAEGSIVVHLVPQMVTPWVGSSTPQHGEQMFLAWRHLSSYYLPLETFFYLVLCFKTIKLFGWIFPPMYCVEFIA